MSEENTNGTSDSCGEGEDDHTFSLRLEFELQEEEDGRVSPSTIAIHSHIHNCPSEAVAETLVIVAHKMLSDAMAHNAFENVADHSIAHRMGQAAASAMLAEVLRRAPEALSMEVQVPDDISELTGD